MLQHPREADQGAAEVDCGAFEELWDQQSVEAPVFGLRLLLKSTLKTASELPFPKRKAVVRGNSIFGTVEPCELLETRSSSHDASGSK